MSYPSVILAEPSLQSYWKFDEASGSPADSKGALSGTVTGTLTYAQAGSVAGGNAILSDGASPTRVTFGNNYAFSGTNPFTLEAWVNRGTDTDGRFISKYDENLGHGYHLTIGGSKLYFQRHNGTVSTDITGGTTLAANTWYHVAATYDGSNIRIYVNGVSDATAVASTQSESAPTSKPFTIFASADTSFTTGSFYLGGMLQHVAVYNAALSAATLLSHYQAASTAVAATDSGTGSDSSQDTVTRWWAGVPVAGDTFTDTDGTILSSHTPTGPNATGTWTKQYPTSNANAQLRISSNQVYARNSVAATTTAIYRHSTTVADGYIEADAICGSGASYAILRFRDTGGESVETCYDVVVDNGGGGVPGKVWLRKLVAGSPTTLGSAYNLGHGTTNGALNGVTVKVRAEFSGSAIRIYVDGTLAISVTDTSATTGVCTLHLFASDGTVQSTGVQVDNVVIASFASLVELGADTGTGSDSSSLNTAGGATIVSTSDSGSGSDGSAVTAKLYGTPSGTRAASGSLVTVAAGGTIGTATAHRAFPTLVRQRNGALRVFYRRGTSHASYDGSLVSCTSTDGGQTWSAEQVIFAATGTYEYRQAVPRLLASGRIGVALYKRTTSDTYFAQYAYSDDNGATWSTPVNVTNAFNANVSVGDDVIELPSGRLVMSMYGSQTYPTTSFTIRTSYSDDGGATWTAQAQPASTIGGFNSVESTMQLLDDGSIYLTFHTEDGLPTDAYYTRSYDGGATWTTPTLLFSSTTYNRHAFCQSPDGDLIFAYSNNTDTVFRQSTDRGASYTAASAGIDTGHSGTGGVWASPAVIGNQGDTPDVGVVTAWENSSQDQASVYFRALTPASTPTLADRGTGTEGISNVQVTGNTAVSANDTATGTDASSAPVVTFNLLSKSAVDSATGVESHALQANVTFQSLSSSDTGTFSEVRFISGPTPRIIRNTSLSSTRFGVTSVSSSQFGSVTSVTIHQDGIVISGP